MPAPAGPVAAPAVTEARSTDALAWNEFIRADPASTFCHRWEWGDFFAETFGHRPRYLVARDTSGDLEGVLPIVEMRAIDGRHHISVPYLNYGGPLGSSAARDGLVRHGLDAARRAGAKGFELRARQHAPAGLSPAREKVTVVLPLPENVDELWKTTYRAKLRSQIRRAQKEAMEVRFGPDRVTDFYRVFSRNMRDLGTPVLPRRFFTGLLKHFPDSVIFGCVYAEGQPVAAGCGFEWQGEFEMTWASSLREFNARAPNMLLYSSFMEEMVNRGAAAFNFGRCTPGGGTHRFKLQWGGQDEPLHWGMWPAPTGGDDEPGGAFDLASRLWQRLPLPVAETLGPLIAARLRQF